MKKGEEARRIIDRIQNESRKHFPVHWRPPDSEEWKTPPYWRQNWQFELQAAANKDHEEFSPAAYSLDRLRQDFPEICSMQSINDLTKVQEEFLIHCMHYMHNYTANRDLKFLRDQYNPIKQGLKRKWQQERQFSSTECISILNNAVGQMVVLDLEPGTTRAFPFLPCIVTLSIPVLAFSSYRMLRYSGSDLLAIAALLSLCSLLAIVTVIRLSLEGRYKKRRKLAWLALYLHFRELEQKGSLE